MEIISSDYLYKDSAKAAKIYEIILDNINIENIEDSQIETERFNQINLIGSLNYIKEIGNKKDETEGKINQFSEYFKNNVFSLISEIQEELDKCEKLNNLIKLCGWYYLFKIIKAKDIYEESDYMRKIDEVVIKILMENDYYYRILMHLDQFKEDMFGDNKDEKVNGYFKILFFLNEKMFINLLTKFMNTKIKRYPQYSIPLPLISFKLKDIKAKMKEIYNILYILRKSETFKTGETFEYFYSFRAEHKLLGEINYILVKLGKKPLAALDKCSDEIAEEAIKYSINNTEKNEINDDYISELSLIIEEGKKKQELLRKEREILNEKYEKLNKKYKELNEKYKNLDTSYTNDLEQMTEKLMNARQNLVKSNEEKNKKESEMKSLKDKLLKNEDIIERISYRQVGSKIIKFFSLSQSEDRKRELTKNNISLTNINAIVNYIKSNLSDYYKYMRENGADLFWILMEIKAEKKSYDDLVHDKDKDLNKYIELMNKRDNRLGPKINFIFNNSELIYEYVFKKNNKINENQIFEEFKKKDNEYKKQKEELKKTKEDC